MENKIIAYFQRIIIREREKGEEKRGYRKIDWKDGFYLGKHLLLFETIKWKKHWKN
jgi:hypothetical protein